MGVYPTGQRHIIKLFVWGSVDFCSFYLALRLPEFLELDHLMAFARGKQGHTYNITDQEKQEGYLVSGKREEETNAASLFPKIPHPVIDISTLADTVSYTLQISHQSIKCFRYVHSAPGSDSQCHPSDIQGRVSL